MKNKKDIQVFLDGYKAMVEALYGEEKDFEKDEKYLKFVSNLKEVVKASRGDLDVEISVSYRLGQVGKTSGVTKYKKAGSICTVAQRGFSLPEDITWFEIVAKPVIKDSGLVFTQASKKKALYSQKIVVAKDDKFEDLAEEREFYNVGDDVQVFAIEDLKENCPLINFKRPKEIVVN